MVLWDSMVIAGTPPFLMRLAAQFLESIGSVLVCAVRSFCWKVWKFCFSYKVFFSFLTRETREQVWLQNKNVRTLGKMTQVRLNDLLTGECSCLLPHPCSGELAGKDRDP